MRHDVGRTLTPTTALLPPAPSGNPYWRPRRDDDEPLDYAPAFMISPSRRAHYCHRPRSGHRRPDGRTSYSSWCGQLLYNPIPVDRPDAATPLCGSCEGKAVGAGWPAASDIVLGAVTFPVVPQRFTPRPYFDPPRRCPGGQRDLYLPDPANWRRGTCMVCGAAVALRASGAWWSDSSFGPVHHPPEHIIPPCRWHAWRYLEWIDPSRHLVGCRCQMEPR